MTANSTVHELFMHRCIELAKLGLGSVSPNPMVGSVIVHKNVIIGEGYHRKFGDAHAEVNAIQSVKNKALLGDSTIYVSLEPCAHHGKTPPCADLIVASKIPKVIIGMQDPFAKVDGLGIKKLRDAGVEVEIGILEEKCQQLNKAFICFYNNKRPYIILKWAETLDGFIDIERNEDSVQEPNWITNEVCRSLVHKWRTESDAIMIGTQTAINDNPKLNVRSWTGKDPIRIVFDRYLRLPQSLNLFDQSQNTIVFNTLENREELNLIYIKITGEDFYKACIFHLKQLDIQSVFVEGGKILLQELIDANLWDEARIFKGNISFGKGVSAPRIQGELKSNEKLKDNSLMVINNNNLY